jgi:glycosyltransferase involved in cell wall biosynthesis
LKILLLNQTFQPDVVSTAQHLTDLALALQARGHEVTVIASRRAYDDPTRRFPKSEVWRGIKIERIASTGFGKGAKWKRAADFGSFILACCWRLLWLPRPDAVVALTSPPLISFIGAVFAKWRRARFYYWVMDMNPDEAIAAGWLRENSVAARMLHRMSRFSLRRAEKIIALDRFMQARIEAKGIAQDKIAVIAPWSHDDAVRFDAAGRDEFRRAHGLTDKFVVMYSGNHSLCHPLDTLLQAAQQLAGETQFAFLFVGGGSEQVKVKRFAAEQRLGNIICLPYQPLERLAGSLSAADLQVVVMGDPFVGTIHPCKIYNIIAVAAPVLYIGPESSHVTEVLADLESVGGATAYAARHGDEAALVGQIRTAAHVRERLSAAQVEMARARFSAGVLRSRLVAELEGK